MILESELTMVGKVNKTHGVDGEMSVTFFDAETIDVIEDGTCVLFRIDGIFVPFFVDGVRPRGNESLLLHLQDEDSQEAASFFVGMEMYMRTSDLPEMEDAEDDGLYAAQLIGYLTATVEGEEIGRITDIDDSTDNPLFIIERPDGSQVFVPIVDEFIEDIDTDGKKISFDLPEGLLDI